MKRCVYTILMVLIMAFMAGAEVHAQNENEIKQLVKNYMKALASQEEGAINNAWLALKRNDKALAYMRSNMPRLYQSYEFWRVKRELEELKRKRFLSSSFGGIKAGPGLKSYSRTDRSNQERVRENPNSRQRSNRSVATSFPNQDRRPNQDVVRDSPNQNRLSNQERIRNRLRSIR